MAQSAFDEAIRQFSIEYADQNQRDYERMCAASESGEIAAELGI